MEYLQDTELTHSTRSLLSKIQKVFRNQIQPLQQQYKPQLDGIDFTRFLWAWVCVGSRTFGRFLPYPSLVPFADMLNHVNVHTTYCWDGANAVYFNDARAPAAAGSELCFSCAAPALPCAAAYFLTLTVLTVMDPEATRCCSCTMVLRYRKTHTTVSTSRRPRALAPAASSCFVR